jgi:hypothetical protein
LRTLILARVCISKVTCACTTLKLRFSLRELHNHCNLLFSEYTEFGTLTPPLFLLYLLSSLPIRVVRSFPIRNLQTQNSMVFIESTNTGALSFFHSFGMMPPHWTPGPQPFPLQRVARLPLAHLSTFSLLKPVERNVWHLPSSQTRYLDSHISALIEFTGRA